MASINYISGNILNANLVRGPNLAISSTTNANIIFFDTTNGRVGILTDSPTSALEVNGVLTVGNVSISNTGGNINAGTNYINNVLDPVQNQDAATKKYVDENSGSAALGNLNISNTTISTTLGVGNITLAPTGSATVILDTSSGLVLPVGNIAQRPSTAATGTMRFNNEIGQVEVYDGANWGDFVANITNQTAYGNNVQTTFTLNQNSTAASILVSLNGIIQIPNIAYTITGGYGNQLVFANAPAISDAIDIRFL